MWIRRRGLQAEGAHFFSYVFNPFLTGRASSTVGVRPTGKKGDQHYSKDECRPGYPKLSIREFHLVFCLSICLGFCFDELFN